MFVLFKKKKKGIHGPALLLAGGEHLSLSPDSAPILHCSLLYPWHQLAPMLFIKQTYISLYLHYKSGKIVKPRMRKSLFLNGTHLHYPPLNYLWCFVDFEFLFLWLFRNGLTMDPLWSFGSPDSTSHSLFWRVSLRIMPENIPSPSTTSDLSLR